ncbi:unnamed protein product [Caenorhabditis brenneri]
MLLPAILLCTVSALALGYGGYDNGSKEHKCGKLKHYNVEAKNGTYLHRKAKFTHLERHDKYYTMIICPNDAYKYALVAENEGSVFNIYGTEYLNTAVLAAGFNVGVVAKCDGKRTTAETTHGKKIRIKKVACIQITDTPGTNPPLECSKCDMNLLKPVIDFPGTKFTFKETIAPDGCKTAKITCETISGSPCQKISIGVYDINGADVYVSSADGVTSISADITCKDDGGYWIDDPDMKALKSFDCTPGMCTSVP